MTNVYFLKPQGIKSNSITDLKRKQQFYPISPYLQISVSLTSNFYCLTS